MIVISIVKNPSMVHLKDARAHMFRCPNPDCSVIHTKYVDVNIAMECKVCKTSLPKVIEMSKTQRGRLEYHLAPALARQRIIKVSQAHNISSLLGFNRRSTDHYGQRIGPNDDIIAGLGMEY